MQKNSNSTNIKYLVTMVEIVTIGDGFSVHIPSKPQLKEICVGLLSGIGMKMPAFPQEMMPTINSLLNHYRTGLKKYHTKVFVGTTESIALIQVRRHQLALVFALKVHHALLEYVQTM